MKEKMTKASYLLLVAFMAACDAAIWTGTGRWDSFKSAECTISNNVFGTNIGAQTTWVNSCNQWGVWANHDQDPDATKAYSHIRKGVNAPVSKVKKLTADFNFSPSNAGNFYAGFLIWDSVKGFEGSNNEIAVWVYNRGMKPRSTNKDSNGNSIPVLEKQAFAGKAWNVYKGTNGNLQVTTVVLRKSITSGSVDLLAIFNFLKSKGQIGDMNIGAVEFGFGINTAPGGQNFQVNSYTLNADPSTSSGSSGGGSSGGSSGGSGGGGGFDSSVQQGKTTRYWDCCKGSCGWPDKAAGLVNAPLMSCAKDGVSQVDANTQNVCFGGNSYMCNNNQPWAINDSLSYGFAAGHLSGKTERDWCCSCYEFTFTSGPVNGKKMIVQVTNTGGDLGHNHFDLQIPGGGVGIFNGCQNQWGTGGDGWGQRYGGVGSRAECSQLPTQLQAGCHWRFDWFQNADNPTMNLRRVKCPAEITQKSKCQRNDE